MPSLAVFFEQTEYPETRRDEKFLQGLGKTKKFKARYVFQLDLSKKGVQTHWGVIKRSLIGGPDIEPCAQALLGDIASDYHLPMGSFKLVKTPPWWWLASQATVAFELKPSLSLYETQVTIRQYPVQVTDTLQKTHHLLELVRVIAQKSQPSIYPLSVQILFQPAQSGTTRMRKQKRKAGDRWTEDTHKITKQEVQIAENQRGKVYGYFQVTVRILAPKRAIHLLAVVNKEFSFRQVSARKAIVRFNKWAFGKKVGMSALTLKRLLNVPTGDVFGREFLKAPTVSRFQGRIQRTEPFVEEGYLLGYDGDSQPIHLTDRMLRAHLAVWGATGIGKTSTLRQLAKQLARSWTNRLLVMDFAGEYSTLLQDGFVLLRPGSADFPLGFNFLDWAQTLGVSPSVTTGWIMKILNNFVRRQGEFTPKMRSMLRQAIQRLLEKGGTLFDLVWSLESMRTELRGVRREVKAKIGRLEPLTEDEEALLAGQPGYDLTVEALINRLIELYQSPLRNVFYVERTTVSPADLLTHNIVIDLKFLQEQQVSRDLIQLFVEFLLLYIFQTVIERHKGRSPLRNIILIEEAQQLTPEVFQKPTAIDGTQSEVMLGTLGGFGLSFIFVSAQPHKVSQAILTNTHTSLVFGMSRGVEAHTFARKLGVAQKEVAMLQWGTLLLTSRGKGVVKVTADTINALSEVEQRAVEALQLQFPPALLKKTRAHYAPLPAPPKGEYAKVMDAIAAYTVRNEGQPNAAKRELGCWAQSYCHLCEKNSRIFKDAFALAKKFWQRTKKGELRTLLKLYPQHPGTLYQELLTFIQQQKGANAVSNPELVAFCAHWCLFEMASASKTTSAVCQDLLKMGPEKLVRLLADLPEIQRLLTLGAQLLDTTRTAFAIHDAFCGLCPLEKGLREMFCARYRQKAFDKLQDEPLLLRLQRAYNTEYRLFLQTCFDELISKNPSVCYCLATSFLRGVRITPKQREVLIEQTEAFLAKLETATPPIEIRLREATEDVRRIVAEDLLKIEVQTLSLGAAYRVASAINGGRIWAYAVQILGAAVAYHEEGRIPANFPVSALPAMLGELHRWGWWFTPEQRERYLPLLKEPTLEPPSSKSREENIFVEDEIKITDPSDAITSEFDRAIEVIEEIFAQNRGIVSRGEFIQQLNDMGEEIPQRVFYKIVEQLGVKKFHLAIQKHGQDPSKVRTETHFVSPAYNTIDTLLDMSSVIHDYCLQGVKNFLAMYCSVKDGGRHDLEDEKLGISDLWATFGKRITYIEFTTGGRKAMRNTILKIADHRSANKPVLLVGLEKPSRRQSGVGVKSNRREAQEIAAKEKVHLKIFTLTNLDELLTWCMTGKLPYNHPTR